MSGDPLEYFPTDNWEDAFRTKVFPVIHHLNDELTLKNAELVFQEGVDGVFVISMEGNDEAVPKIAAKIKALYPNRKVGINLLTVSASKATEISIGHGLDMTWADSCGVSSEGFTEEATWVRLLLNFQASQISLLESHKNDVPHQFFGSIAFKYQKTDKNPAQAALNATKRGFIPVTSGSATGKAAPVEKLRLMREALGNFNPLGLASGVTPENIEVFRKYATHILVSTGISEDFHTFSREKVRALMEKLSCNRLKL